jgi:hypothetical protein
MDFLIEFLHDGIYFILFLIVAIAGGFCGSRLRKLKDGKSKNKESEK